MNQQPTEREWRQAQDAGASARRNGRPITSVPHYGSGHKARVLAEAWEESWRAVNAEPGRKAL